MLFSVKQQQKHLFFETHIVAEVEDGEIFEFTVLLLRKQVSKNCDRFLLETLKFYFRVQIPSKKKKYH